MNERDNTDINPDDVEGHAGRYGGLAEGDENVEGHAYRPGRVENSEGDDVEGHSVKAHVEPEDDTEGHASRFGGIVEQDDEVEGHSARYGGLTEE
jgi:hypothetical protein